MKNTKILLLYCFSLNAFTSFAKIPDSIAMVKVPTLLEFNINSFQDNILEIPVYFFRPPDTSKTKDIILNVISDTIKFANNKYLILFNDKIFASKKDLNSKDSILRIIRGIIKLD